MNLTTQIESGVRGSALCLTTVLTLCSLISPTPSAMAVDDPGFRGLPWLQNPHPNGITIRWLSETDLSGTLTIAGPGQPREWRSQPVEARTLVANPFQTEPGGPHRAAPWIHTIRLDGLTPGTRYLYKVTQGTQNHVSEFRTAPAPESDQPIRLIVYSDSETEPESSSSPPVDWPVPSGSNRPAGITKYVVDQTVGYRANNQVIADRQPHLVLLVGDLVECGGEQRDWDEFWRHNAGEYGRIASSVPFVAALGNHENYGGPGGGYSAEAANFGTEKFLTYFDAPDNGASNPRHKGRYYRLNYGPLALIVLDSSDGLPHKSASDTNHNLDGSHAPDFNPGSEQYRWLETQLADAQKTSAFTFVQFHHTMYGSGPHSIPFGAPGFSGQAGIPMRVLAPLFFRYGVDAVFSGHDELLERSLALGTELLPDGASCSHQIHFYDVGVGGDGLRGPSAGFDNPYRQFLAHDNAPEIWEGSRLISGGKHYGHLEVNVTRADSGHWQAEIAPIHVFPVLNDQGELTAWERRAYADIVTLHADR
jgi:hypothetical protein